MLENIKTKGSYSDKIYGITEINHRLRVKGKLTCNEYVLCSAIESYQIKNVIDFSAEDIYRNTGLKIDYFKTKLIPKLIIDGYIRIHEKTKRPQLTDKWFNIFTISNLEFDNFWCDKSGQFGEKDKVVWMGSKKQALKLYKKVREKFSENHLLRQRYYYFKFLDLYNNKYNTSRQKMMATVWLNPQNERFNEDWKQYCKDLKVEDNEVQKRSDEYKYE